MSTLVQPQIDLTYLDRLCNRESPTRDLLHIVYISANQDETRGANGKIPLFVKTRHFGRYSYVF